MPSCPVFGKHKGVSACVSKIMAVCSSQHVLGPPSDQYHCAAAVRGVVDSVGLLPLSVSGSIPQLRMRTMYFSHPYVLLTLTLSMFLYLWIFSLPFHFFCHTSNLRHSLTTYTLTQSMGLYLLSPPCHISITRQNGYGLLLGSHLHISLS